MNLLIEKFFKNRGYTDEYLSSIEDASHSLLMDIDKLSTELKTIHDSQDAIVVMPDYDMDGIMSGVIGYAGLSELGFNVILNIPNPNDGYGFDAAVINRVVAEYPSTKAIISCDNGISCYDGIDRAKELGLKVLITDHHKTSATPAADVVVDPMRPDETYEHPRICGAYVLYQCLQHYADTYCDYETREKIFRLRVFAGIGTVSDVMPVIYENRSLVKDAIALCRFVYASADNNISVADCSDVYRRAFNGLYLALKAFADAGSINNLTDIDEQFFGFLLAPAFNSVKRLGGDMSTAFGVFFGAEPEQCMVRLMEMNAERKLLVEQHLKEISMMVQPYAPYIFLSYAPGGIAGLLATKLLQEYGYPVCVVAADGEKYYGSGRSPEWYSFLSRVPSIDGCNVAGHEGAFGVSFENEDAMHNLFFYLSADVPAVRDTIEFTEASYDAIVATDGSGDTKIDIDLFRDYLDEIEQYRPFGKGFTAPNILLRFKPSEAVWSTIGSNKQHLKLRLPYGLEVLCWNQASKQSLADGDDFVEVVGDFKYNEFANRLNVNFYGDIINA